VRRASHWRRRRHDGGGRGAALGAPLAFAIVVLTGAGAGCAGLPIRPSTGVTASTSTSTPRWHVRLLPGDAVDRGVVATHLCFSGPPPSRVGPEHRPALAFLLGSPQALTPAGVVLEPALEVDDRGIVTESLPPGACVRFDVDVETAALAIDRRDVAVQVGRVIVASPDVWLWRPLPWPADVDAGVLEIEPDRAAALPFERDSTGAYVVRASTFSLQSYGAFGALGPRERRHRRGVELDVVSLTSAGPSVAQLGAWLEVAVDDVAGPLGHFPTEHVLVLVWPVSGQRPIVSGFLGRGGGVSAIFLVDDDVGEGAGEPEGHASANNDDGRWVLTHELAHALLPPIRRGDAWFNEGLTTWHQEVLPARAGRRLRSEASAQLARGFRTGAARAARDGLSLERACAERDRLGTDQHCYWGGAALIELLADEVGDDGVEALVRAVHGSARIDAPPASAEAVLMAIAHASTSSPVARRAAERLLVLWRRHRDGHFPDVEAARRPDALEWPDAS
jgi:hypothetical protein